MNVALLCITHDPAGDNLSYLKSIQKHLIGFYSKKFVVVSDQTSKAVIEALYDLEFDIKIVEKRGVANARRDAIRFILDTGIDFFHYCDLDRLITWCLKYPDELIDICNIIPTYDYTIIGRTKRAFHSHPKEWMETEKISNKIFSLEFGTDVDVTAGSCGFSKDAIQYLIKHSKDEMTDAEWPMIIKRIAGLEVGYKEVEGLEYDDNINAVRTPSNESNRWFNRLKLSYIISQSAINTGKK